MAKKQELATVERPETWLTTLEAGTEAAEALRENLLPGETIDIPDLVRIPCPSGGSTMWEWEEHGEVQHDAEVCGVLVAFQARGVLWPSEEPGDNAPLLVTHDFITAEKVGDVDPDGDITEEELEQWRLPNGRYDWQNMPWSQWKSASKGKGKRVKEQRLLFILREMATWPVLVTAQPGSLRDVVRFIKTLPVPHYRAVVGLSLLKEKTDTGIDYAKIKPRMIMTLDHETGQKVKASYTQSLKQAASTLAVEADD